MRKVVGLSICASIALGNIVHSNFSFQEYIDFGRNKGRFTPGAKNIYIMDKSGKKYEIDPEVHMPDFVGITDTSGVTTLIEGPYIYTAAHTIIDNMYTLDRKYDKIAYEEIGFWYGDLAYVRYDKFITSLVPPEATVDFTENFVPTTDLYPYAWRSGQGLLKYVQVENDKYTTIQSSGVRTGGFLKWDFWSKHHGGLLFFKDTDFFSNGTTKGDSGSPILLWDKSQKKWVVGGSTSRSNEYHGGQFAVYKSELLKTLQKKTYTHSNQSKQQKPNLE